METKVVYGHARLTFTLGDTDYMAVRGPDKQITLITSGKISAYDYKDAILIATNAFRRMDDSLVFSMEKVTHESRQEDSVVPDRVRH
jgi:hypothetical protein